MIDIGHLMGITLLDHVIVNGYDLGEYSLRQNAIEHGLDFSPPRSLFEDPRTSRIL